MGIFDNISGIKGGSLNKDDFQKKVKSLSKYYEDLINCLNETAKKSTPYITFAIPDENQINDLAGQIPSLEYFQGEFEKIFPEQIRSAWEVIVSLIMGEKQEHVTGLTQLGKNGLITVLLDFLGVVAGAYEVIENKNEDPKILIPVAWLPNAINMEKQSIEKFGQSMLLNGIIRCHIGDKIFALGDYHETFTMKLKQAIVKTIENDSGSNTDRTKFKKLIADFFSKNSSALILRRSTSKDKFYRWLFEGAQSSKLKIVLVMDESHIAIGKNQGADKILGAPIPTGPKIEDPVEVDEQDESFDLEQDPVEADEQEEKKNVDEEFAETTEILNTYKTIFKDEAKLITVSATNTVFNILKYEKGDKPVYLEVASGYCGFPFVDGDDYPLGKGVKTQEPIVKSIKEIAREFKLPDLELLNLRTLDSVMGFGLYMMDKDWLTICEKLNDNFLIICSKLDVKITGDFGPPGNGWISRVAKVLNAISDSKAKDVVTLFNDILMNCGMTDFLDQNEFTRLFTHKTGVSRKNYLKYLATKENSRLEKGWLDAIKKAQKSLGDLFDYLLLTTNPQNKKGCILRWECLNESYDRFIKELAEKRFKEKICFIPYIGESAKSTVYDLLKTANPNKLPYLITVTGRGRYGESYPRDCGYAIDCTTKNSTAHSFFQSLLGRLTGYGKYDPINIESTRPLLILSDLAYEKVFLELKNGKGFSLKVGTGLNLVKTGLDFKPIEIVCINRGPKDLEGLFNSLDGNFDSNLTIAQIQKKIDIDLFDLIVPYCDLIEKFPEKFIIFPTNFSSAALKNINLKILLPGEKVDDSKARELDWIGNEEGQTRPGNARTKVAFELQSDKYKDGSRKFGLRSTRNRKGKEFLHIGFQINDKKQVQSIFVWLKKPIESTVTGPTTGAVGIAEGSVPDRFNIR